MSRIAALALTVVLTLGGMYAGMRIAGPKTRGYNLGTLSYEVEPTAHGRVEIVIPRTGLRLHAKVIDAPYVLRVKPRSFSVVGLAQVALGAKSALHTAKNDIVHGAIWAFVRALLYALGGGIVGAVLSGILVLLFRGLGTALLSGVLGVVIAVVIAAGSGLWVWKAHYIQALEHPTLISGRHSSKLNLSPYVRKIRRAHSLEEVIRDLAPLLVRVARG